MLATRFPSAILASLLVGCAAPPPGPATPGLAPVAPMAPRLAVLPDLTLPAPPVPLPPSPTAVPAPKPSAVPGFAPVHELVAFVSNRGGHGFDVFLYDASARTVWAPPGVNTAADEFNPSLSHGNRWLVYASTASGSSDIRLFDLRTQLVNALEPANTPGEDVSPTIDEAGHLIAYTSREAGLDRLHLFDLRTGANYLPAAVARLGTPIANPFISADARRVAFASPVKDRGLDLFVYDLETARVWSPPFLNSTADDDEPVLSPVDDRVLFSTRRTGNLDVMEGNLRTGAVDPLPLANTRAAELTPGYLGARADRILFVSDRDGAGDRRLLVYNPHLGILDTLPVSHEVGSEDTISPP